jgi:hypothetical protein
MAFDGNGAYQHPSPQFPFLTGTTISAEAMNDVLAEIASALSNVILRDGSGAAPTASIKWGLQKLVQLGTGSDDNDAVNFAQVFKNPTFTSPRAQASPAADDNSLKLATTEYVRNLAFNSALPGQTMPKAGYALATNGTTADWQSLDSRGIKYLNKGNATAAVALDFSEAEAHALTIVAGTAPTITFTGWPENRTAVRLLTLTNAGLAPPTFSGVVWIDPDGKETASFAATGVAWQTNGRDRIIIVKEPNLTPWAKVIR